MRGVEIRAEDAFPEFRENLSGEEAGLFKASESRATRLPKRSDEGEGEGA